MQANSFMHDPNFESTTLSIVCELAKLRALARITATT